MAFAKTLTADFGVASVPGGTFYWPPQQGRTKVRFMFAKKEETLHEAGKRLLKVRELADPGQAVNEYKEKHHAQETTGQTQSQD